MIEIVLQYVMPAALSLLPPEMNTPAARAMLLAIGLQESKFLDRRQVVKGGALGPARGFWQFEKHGGLKGVMTHRLTQSLAIEALGHLRYQTKSHVVTSLTTIHATLEHNDILACVFARLLLWTVPAHLPRRNQPKAGWAQYLEAWRPGQPHPDTWDVYFLDAWDRVDRITAVAHGGVR